jgi:hypothetical protein
MTAAIGLLVISSDPKCEGLLIPRVRIQANNNDCEVEYDSEDSGQYGKAGDQGHGSALSSVALMGSMVYSSGAV